MKRKKGQRIRKPEEEGEEGEEEEDVLETSALYLNIHSSITSGGTPPDKMLIVVESEKYPFRFGS